MARTNFDYVGSGGDWEALDRYKTIFYYCYIINFVNNSDLLKKILKFRKERNWKKFHTPKNLAISISLEANELLEHYQWLSTKESLNYSKKNKTEISEEMADVFIYLLLMAHDLDIDLLDASIKKIKKNNKKYPVEKSKGTSKKYNKF